MNIIVSQIIAALDADNAKLAYDLAYDNGVVLTEIWSDSDGDDIIGMMVDDITVYFREDN